MDISKQKLKSTVIIAVYGMAVVLGYVAIITIFKGNIKLRMQMSDVIIPFFNIFALLGLFYAVKNSKNWGKRIYLPWVFLLIAQSLYLMGDLNWAILNTLFKTQPFPSGGDLFYILCYPFFAMGILYFPRITAQRKKYKTLLDIVIVLMSAALFLGIFLNSPDVLKTKNPLELFLTVLYIVMCFVLFYIAYDLVFNKIKDLTDMILILLVSGLTLDIATNVTFYYLLLNHAYIEGSLIDVGWLVSNLMVGIAGFIQGSRMKHGIQKTTEPRDPEKFNWTSYIPLLLVCASYILVNVESNIPATASVLAKVVMGIIIFLVVVRQIMSMNENRRLYMDAQDEIKKRVETEKTLTAEMQRAEMYFNIAGVILVVLDLRGNVVLINEKGCEVLGYSETEIKGKNWFENFIPEHARACTENIFRGLKDEDSTAQFEDVENRILSKGKDELIVSWHNTVLRDGDGNIIGTLSSGEDVTQKVLQEKRSTKKADQTIRMQKALLELSKNSIPELGEAIEKLVEVDFKILGVEETSVWFLNQGKDELECFNVYSLNGKSNGTGKKFKSRDICNYLDLLRESRSLASNDVGCDPRIEELRISRSNDFKSLLDVPIWFNGVMVGVLCHRNKEKRNWSFEDRDFAASISSMISTSLESCERKDAEEKIKESLKEKELLLREIHHRVKNNMQIISSLLNLQSNYVEDEEAVKTLKESQSRVKSMALVHEKLYNSNNLANIDFVGYVKSLVSNLVYTYVKDPEKIRIKTEGSDIHLNMDTSVPCGLIINELVTNSIKHAFPNGMGEIIVKLDHSHDEFFITVTDNGAGFPEDLDFRNTKTLGLQLVNSLVNQIDGSITLSVDGGTSFSIKFRELKYRARI